MKDSEAAPKKIMSDMVTARSSRNAPPSRARAEFPKQKPTQVHVDEPVEISQPEQPRLRAERRNVSSSPQKMGCAIWLVGLVCAAALAFVIGGFIATARIIVTPKQFTGTVDYSATLSQSGDQGMVRFFTATKTFSEEQVIAAQSAVVKDSFASGTVRFYNALPQAKTLPAKTIIRSSNTNGQIVNYVIKSPVSIPGAKNKKPGQKDVAVAAEKVGADANIDVNDFVLAVPVAGITARSLTPMKGGAQGSDKVADPAAVAEAQAALLQNFSLADNLAARMTEELPADMIALPITFVESVPAIAVESNHEDGVHVIASKAIAITMVRRADLARLLGDRLNIPKDIQLTLNDLDGVTITTSTLASPRAIPATISVRISGTPTLFGLINEPAIKDAVRAKSRREASTNLSSVAEIEHFAIRMMPFWRRVFPVDLEKISVTTKY